MEVLFEKALFYVLSNEGLFVDDPADHGGATFKGITLRMAAVYFNKMSMTIDDLRALTDLQVSAFYQAIYWSPMLLDRILDSGVATALFDISVNQGQGSATHAAEYAVASLGVVPVGPGRWQDYIDTINLIDPGAFIDALHSIVVSKYLGIVKANPTQQKFIQGWLARANKLLTLRTEVA